MIYTGVKGTQDYHPALARQFNNLVGDARAVLERYAYQEIILPVLEDEGVFRKGVGEATDIVERQMLKIEGKDNIILRPEGTAQTVRFFLENSLHKQSDFYKFFYIGSMFRGERPQRGRLRQFNQIGVEVFGSHRVSLDAEVIKTASQILAQAGVGEVELKINTLGCLRDKEAFSRLLVERIREHAGHLCEDCRRRREKNPLRIIDCKNDKCKNIVKGLNLEGAHLCAPCKDRFDDLGRLIKEAGVAFVYDPYLVRGLDYYTGTVFEFTSQRLGAQDAIGAGGRYDTLVERLGGPSIPAIGFALGIERMLIALGEPKNETVVAVYVAATSPAMQSPAFMITQQLRDAGINTETDHCEKSLKGQFRYAQRLGVRYVVLVGDEEIKENCVMLKNMQTSGQEKVKIDDLTNKIKNFTTENSEKN
jgi:histidyl-tRNA synthetase